MSSSTKMYGPGMWWTSHSRTTIEPATIAVSQAASGTPAARSRRLLATELELGEPSGDLRRLRAPRRDPHRRGGVADLVQHRALHGPAPGDALERRRLELRHALQV